MQCNVAPFIITDQTGNTFIPSDKQIVEQWIHECKSRYPGHKCKIPDMTSEPEGSPLSPPPPPGGLQSGNLTPPPPPPSKMFEGLTPPPPPS